MLNEDRKDYIARLNEILAMDDNQIKLELLRDGVSADYLSSTMIDNWYRIEVGRLQTAIKIIDSK